MVSKQLPTIDTEYLHHKVKSFTAGNIRNYIRNWEDLTGDINILDIVKNGLKLNFTDAPPDSREPFEYPRSKTEFEKIDVEVRKLLKKGVVEYCNREEGEYFSNLFTTPKKDGTHRTILNLKSLNKDCDTKHFKMESLKQALHMVRQGSYMASIDIKDAFYSVPIQKSHKKYLKFMWAGNMLQFCAMPNGYCDAMRIFTKLLKPAFSNLRERGFESVIYVDDSFLMDDSFQECWTNIKATLQCLQSLGFVIHPDKSVLYPTQELIFLGFIINTVNMTITLVTEKKEKIVIKGKGLLHRNNITIRMVSSFIGSLTSSFDAVPFGRLHYRHLEWCKTEALKASYYDFDGPCSLTAKAVSEINWWLDNITDSFAYIKDIPDIGKTIHTDASKHLGGGWGASDGIHQDINGRWSEHEQKHSINCLELKAVKLALQSYVPCYTQCKHVRVMSDNTTAISYINKQGGTHCMIMNDLAVEIWEYCRQMNIHVSAAHIPGKHNILADIASREFHDAAEWKLCPQIFCDLVDTYGQPDIDLFASRLNYQIPTYASWKPDPESAFIDAMQINWEGMFIYAFPPFSMIWPMITKMCQDKVKKALIVVPAWPTQSWYPTIMKLRLPYKITTIHSSKLSLPGTEKIHPLAPKLRLLAMLCTCQRQY